MTRRLQSRKAELYEQYRAGRISREKFADIQKKDSEKLARLSSRVEEIERLLVEQYESRGNLATGKRTADQIILLKEYDPEIIRNFVERVRVYPSGEIEIDMRTSSGFAYSALLKSIKENISSCCSDMQFPPLDVLWTFTR